MIVGGVAGIARQAQGVAQRTDAAAGPVPILQVEILVDIEQLLAGSVVGQGVGQCRGGSGLHERRRLLGGIDLVDAAGVVDAVEQAANRGAARRRTGECEREGNEHAEHAEGTGKQLTQGGGGHRSRFRLRKPRSRSHTACDQSIVSPTPRSPRGGGRSRRHQARPRAHIPPLSAGPTQPVHQPAKPKRKVPVATDPSHAVSSLLLQSGAAPRPFRAATHGNTRQR